jgi:hypothetical protein
MAKINPPQDLGKFKPETPVIIPLLPLSIEAYSIQHLSKPGVFSWPIPERACGDVQHSPGVCGNPHWRYLI